MFYEKLQGYPMTADEFRAWRDRLGLSLVQAGAALGVTSRAVQFYQSGERPVPLTVEKLCMMLERAKTKKPPK